MTSFTFKPFFIIDNHFNFDNNQIMIETLVNQCYLSYLEGIYFRESQKFAKINPREIFKIWRFAKINARENFQKFENSRKSQKIGL